MPLFSHKTKSGRNFEIDWEFDPGDSSVGLNAGVVINHIYDLDAGRKDVLNEIESAAAGGEWGEVELAAETECDAMMHEGEQDDRDLEDKDTEDE